MSETSAAAGSDALEVVEELWQHELSLCDDYLEIDAHIVDVKLRRASAVLDARLAGKPDPKKDELTSIRARLEVLVSAIDEARRRRRQAIEVYQGREAEDLRRQADDKRTDAAAVLQKTEALRAELLEHEGVEYVVRTAEPQPSGEDGRVAHIVIQLMPRSWTLEQEALMLDAQANEAARREVTDHGVLEAADSGGMIEAVRALSPVVLGPTLIAAAEWARTAYTGQLERDKVHKHFAIRLELRWRNGEIDALASRAYVPMLDS